MIFHSLVSLSMMANVSLDMRAPLPDQTGLQMPLREKSAVLLPLVRRATDCIVRKVKADPRYRSNAGADAINDLIVDSFAACRQPVQAMIDAHDRLFGGGSGAAFVHGPYLEVLPAAVIRQVKMPHQPVR
jgi:hypothetical protein